MGAFRVRPHDPDEEWVCCGRVHAPHAVDNGQGAWPWLQRIWSVRPHHSNRSYDLWRSVSCHYNSSDVIVFKVARVSTVDIVDANLSSDMSQYKLEDR